MERNLVQSDPTHRHLLDELERLRAARVGVLVEQACMDEGALSFVTAMRYSIGILHTNENWRGRMTGVPRLRRPAMSLWSV